MGEINIGGGNNFFSHFARIYIFLTPPILKMLGTFPKNFSQVAISQGFFPKWQLPKSSISQAATSKSVLSAVLGPQPVLTAALGPLAHPRRSTHPHCSLRRLWGPNLTFGKLPLGKLSLGKSPKGNYLFLSSPTFLLNL